MGAFFRVIYIFLCYLSVFFTVTFGYSLSSRIVYDYFVWEGNDWLLSIPVIIGTLIIVSLYILLMVKEDLKKKYRYIFSIIVMLPLIIVLLFLVTLTPYQEDKTILYLPAY